MSRPIRTTSPAGEPIVILSADEYDRLVRASQDAQKARTVDQALSDYRAGQGDPLTADEMRALVAAPTQLHFWRRKRGLSQARLADLAGCSQPYLNQLESGKRTGSMDTFRKLAAALDLTIGQLDDNTTTG